MSSAYFLRIILFVSILQFILVFLVAVRNGILPIEQVVIVSSFAFGLVFYGFAHVAFKISLFKQHKRVLDNELDTLIDDIKSGNVN